MAAEASITMAEARGSLMEEVMEEGWVDAMGVMAVVTAVATAVAMVVAMEWVALEVAMVVKEWVD